MPLSPQLEGPLENQELGILQEFLNSWKIETENEQIYGICITVAKKLNTAKTEQKKPESTMLW